MHGYFHVYAYWPNTIWRIFIQLYDMPVWHKNGREKNQFFDTNKSKNQFLHICRFDLTATIYMTLLISIQKENLKRKMLKRRKESNTYLTHVCRHHCSRENSRLHLMKATVLAGSSEFLSFHQVFFMSTDVNQVGVTLVSSF